jgi:hypothetical protein
MMTEKWQKLENNRKNDSETYEGYPESKERFAIKKYVLIIGKKTNMHVVAHSFTNIST